MHRFIISPLFAFSRFFINIYGIFLKFFLQLNGGYWSRIGLAENITEERIKKRKVLEKRTDDDLDTILKRYDTYVETTRPVLDYYSKNSNFHEIDGTLTIDQITGKIEAFLNV